MCIDLKSDWFFHTDVTTVDGSRGYVNNSVYTNTVASLALHYSKYAACLCNIDVNTYAPEQWLYAAQNLHWEYNRTGEYNPEYEGYIIKGTLAGLYIFFCNFYVTVTYIICHCYLHSMSQWPTFYVTIAHLSNHYMASRTITYSIEPLLTFHCLIAWYI